MCALWSLSVRLVFRERNMPYLNSPLPLPVLWSGCSSRRETCLTSTPLNRTKIEKILQKVLGYADTDDDDDDVDADVHTKDSTLSQTNHLNQRADQSHSNTGTISAWPRNASTPRNAILPASNVVFLRVISIRVNSHFILTTRRDLAF